MLKLSFFKDVKGMLPKGKTDKSFKIVKATQIQYIAVFQ